MAPIPGRPCLTGLYLGCHRDEREASVRVRLSCLRDGELSKVVTSHLGLDLDGVEGLSCRKAR